MTIHNFFISHYSNDKDVAEIIAGTIRRITLSQIHPWYSSDSSSSGGLKPGNIWFNEIISKLLKSKAIVAVLTPNSINRPWIYFESGVGEALEGCEVIPICVGVNRDTILPPLGMYQCYSLIDYRSLKEFCDKLLNKFEISFDEEAFKPILEKCINDLSKISFSEKNQTKESELSNKNLLDELKQHMDKRFIETMNQQNSLFQVESKVNDHNTKLIDPISYTITIKFDFPNFNEDHYIEVRNDDTVADIMDSIWYIISDYVPAFTYLQNWIMKDYENNRSMIIREIASMIPASSVFRPDIVWQVESLLKPYNGNDSTNKGGLR